jgi:hypothetical protein
MSESSEPGRPELSRSGTLAVVRARSVSAASEKVADGSLSAGADSAAEIGNRSPHLRHRIELSGRVRSSAIE